MHSVEKGKQSCFFCRESWLKRAWECTVAGQETSWGCQREGNFRSEVDWERMALRYLCLCSMWDGANRTQSPWGQKDPPFHCWGGQRTQSLTPFWVISKYLPENYFGSLICSKIPQLIKLWSRYVYCSTGCMRGSPLKHAYRSQYSARYISGYKLHMH